MFFQIFSPVSWKFSRRSRLFKQQLRRLDQAMLLQRMAFVLLLEAVLELRIGSLYYIVNPLIEFNKFMYNEKKIHNLFDKNFGFSPLIECQVQIQHQYYLVYLQAYFFQNYNMCTLSNNVQCFLYNNPIFT